MMFKIFFFPVTLALILLAIGYSTFTGEVESIKKSTKSTIEMRFTLLNKYIRLISANNAAMRDSIVDAYSDVKSGRYNNESLLDSVSYFKSLDLYGLSPQAYPEIVEKLNGTLTILGNVKLYDPDLRRELSAVLMKDGEFDILSGQAELAVWTYYLSAKGFLYLSPKLPIDAFQFFPELYKKPFWTEVTPSSNPSGRQIISSLYDDRAGQGLMITISTPVTIDKQFLGVVSVDIGIEYMSFILSVGNTVGASFVLDEKKLLVAANRPVSVGEFLPFPVLDSNAQWLEVSDGWLYSAPIRADQLYLAHHLTNSELLINAAKSSAVAWLLLLLGAVLGFFAIFMYQSASKNSLLMLLDPLTQIYNKRGFYTLIKPIYSGLLRSPNSFAVLMIDIDHFKSINDRYGHAAGDGVIESIAKTITRTNRKSSLCSRWGGVAFLVFCQEATPETAQLLAKRVNQAVEKQKHGSSKLDVTVSIGVCVSRATDDIDTIIEQAEQALYKAKEGGRNQVFLRNSL